MLWLALRAASIGLAFVRLVRPSRAVELVRPRTPNGTTSITAIVPARNEATRIVPCLELLSADPEVHEVLVVDDGSNDGTADIAAAHGARVVAAGALPPGWTGKAWAMQRGLDEALGDWVVFLDAHTEPDRGLCGALVARVEADGLTLASAIGRIACRTNAEQIVSAAMLTNLLYRFGPPSGRWRGEPRRVFANGQCLVARRVELATAGDVEAVRSSFVEDVALARHVAGRGGTFGLFDATTRLRVRGYASGRGTWTGWGRTFALGDLTGPAWLAADLAVVWLALALPLGRLLLRRGDVLDAAAVLVRLATLAGTRRAYDEPGVAYWLSPFADAPIAGLYTKAAFAPTRSWRGRTYVRPEDTVGR